MSNILSRALALFAGLLLLSAQGLNAQGPTGAKIRGDVDGDGRVTEADAQAVRAHLVGRPLPQGATILPAGDANGDGRITAVDAAVISRFVAGGDVSRFPVGKPEPGSETQGTGGGGGPSTAGDLFVAQLCEVDVTAGTLSCAAPAPQTGGARPDLILGNPGVALVSGGPATVHKLEAANEDTTQVPVRVRNQIGQPIGTSDGTTLDPDGIRVFFNNGPYVTQVVGGGPIGGATVRMENTDGTATFTPPSGTPVYANKPYYQYDEILAGGSPGATSASQTWQFVYSQNVTRFAYFVFISAPVEFEYGWIDVTPPSSVLAVAGTTTLSAAVFNEFGASVGDGVTWSSSNDAVATVNPSTGLVTGVTPGTVTITATSNVQALRTGTATVIVDAAPTVLNTTPADDATGVAPGGTITINFSESVNATGTAFTLQCPDGSDHAFTASASPAASYVLTPTTPLPSATICEVTVVAAQITDVDTNDGPNNMAADYVFDFTTSNALNGDVYPENVIGNVHVNSSDITPTPFSVTTNDQIAPGAAITFFGWEATSGVTKNGGQVSMTTSGPTIGRFTYNPPAGFEGVDSLKYQVGSAPGDTARMGIPVSGMIWFINNNPGSCTSNCDGRLSNPFTTLAAFQAVNNNTGNNPANNDWIFFYESPTAYGGPLTMLDGQKAVGQDVSIPLATLTGFTVPSGSADLPATNTGDPNRAIIGGSNGIGLAVGNSLAGLSLEPSAGTGLGTNNAGLGFGTLNVTEVSIAAAGTAAALNLDNGTVSPTSAFTSVGSSGGTVGARLNNVNGTVALGTGSINGASNQALLINGGSATVTYGGALANTTGRTVEITSRSAGDITLGGSLSGAGTGILVNAVTGGTIAFTNGSVQIYTVSTNPAVTLTNNTGATIEFTGGGLLLNTDDGPALTATGGGTLRVTGVSNSLTSAGGIALDIQNTTIGTGGVNFASVNANGGLHGIRLLNTGSGGLNVPGGGVIQNTTGHAVTISNAGGSHALQSMNISGGASGNSAVFGNTFGTLNLNASTISATGGPALNLFAGDVGGAIASLSGTAGAGTSGVILDSVDGTLVINAGTITGSAGGPAFLVNGGALILTNSGGITQAANNTMLQVTGNHTGTLTFQTGTLSATNGGGILFNDADGNYNFNGTTTLNGGDAGIDITNGSEGTFSFGTGTSVTNPSGHAFNLSSASNVTYSGNLTKTAGSNALVNLSFVTGGTTTFQTGTLNATAGSGIVANDVTGTINFSGTTTLSNAAQVAIGSNSNGTFNFGTGVSIASGASTRFLVNGSAPQITFSGAITQATAGQRLVDLTNVASSVRQITFQTGTLSATNGTGIQLSNVDGTVNFNGTTTLNGGDAGIDITTGSGGDINFASGTSITNPSGVGLHVSNGTNAADVSYAGTISSNAGRPVQIEGVSGGTVALSGSVTSTSQGILVQNNTGGNINFTGTRTLTTAGNHALALDNNDGATVNLGTATMTINTTSGEGLRVVNGGTVNVTGTANDVTSTTGTTVRISDSDVGGNGVRLRAVNSNGAANGIFLNNTGNTGGQFRVDGTGSVGSGGTLTNSAGADGATSGSSVYMNNTRNVVLNSMILNGSQNFGIVGTTVTNFTLNNSRLLGVHGTNIGFDESVISITGLAGVGAFTNDSITGGIEDNVRILNHGIVGAAGDSIYFDNVRFGHVSSVSGNTNLLVRVADGSNTRVRLRNSMFWGSRGGSMFHLNVVNSATGNLIMAGNTFNNTMAQISGAGGVLITASGTAASTPTLVYNINNNTFRGSRTVALNINKDVGVASINGSIANNTIGVAATANSGSVDASAMQLRHQGGGFHRATVNSNQFFQYNNYGIIIEEGDAVAGGGHGRMDITLTNNTISNPGTNPTGFIINGIHANIGTVTDDQHILCLAATGNTFNASSLGGALQDGRLRQRMRGTIILPGYGGANNDNAAVATFVRANNGNQGDLVVSASNSVGVGAPNGPGFGFINGSCNAPSGVP